MVGFSTRMLCWRTVPYLMMPQILLMFLLGHSWCCLFPDILGVIAVVVLMSVNVFVVSVNVFIVIKLSSIVHDSNTVVVDVLVLLVVVATSSMLLISLG